METLIFWGFGILFALVGAGRRLLKSCLLLWNVVFSAYLAVWSFPLVNSWGTFLPKSIHAWQPVMVLVAEFLALWFLLYSISEKIEGDNAPDYNFPALVDKLGGVFCNGLAGLTLATFLLFTFAASPFHGSISILNGKATAEKAKSSLLTMTSVVNQLSFQPAPGKKESELTVQLLAAPLGLLPEQKKAENENKKDATEKPEAPASSTAQTPDTSTAK